MSKQKAILITGINGFLAKNLSKKFSENQFIVLGLERTKKLKNSNCYKSYTIEEIEKAFIEFEITLIIHAATNYGKNNESISELIDTNISLPLKLLDISLKYQLHNFINIDTVLSKNTNRYSLTKKHFLTLFKDNTYSTIKKRVNIKLEHFYGPGASPKNFIEWIKNEIIKESKNIALTKCTQSRDFIYIDDVVEAIFLISKSIKSFNDFKEFEIGSGNNYVLKDVILDLKKITNSNATFNFGAIEYRENEIDNYTINNNEIINLGWKPKVTLKEGLKRIINNTLYE